MYKILLKNAAIHPQYAHHPYLFFPLHKQFLMTDAVQECKKINTWRHCLALHMARCCSKEKQSWTSTPPPGGFHQRGYPGTPKSSFLMGFSLCKTTILGYLHDYGNHHNPWRRPAGHPSSADTTRLGALQPGLLLGSVEEIVVLRGALLALVEILGRDGPLAMNVLNFYKSLKEMRKSQSKLWDIGIYWNIWKYRTCVEGPCRGTSRNTPKKSNMGFSQTFCVHVE